MILPQKKGLILVKGSHDSVNNDGDGRGLTEGKPGGVIAQDNVCRNSTCEREFQKRANPRKGG